MSGATTAALVTAAVTVGTAAYSARQQRKAEANANDAAEEARRTAAKSTSQAAQNPAPQFNRRRRATTGFEKLAVTPLVNNAVGNGTASNQLLGG